MALDLHAGVLFGADPQDEPWRAHMRDVMRDLEAALRVASGEEFSEPEDPAQEGVSERLGSYSSAGQRVELLQSFAAHVWVHASIPRALSALDERAQARYEALRAEAQPPPSWRSLPQPLTRWGVPESFDHLMALGLNTVYVPRPLRPIALTREHGAKEPRWVASSLGLKRELDFLAQALCVDEGSLWALQGLLDKPSASAPWAGYSALQTPWEEFAQAVAPLPWLMSRVIDWSILRGCSVHLS